VRLFSQLQRITRYARALRRPRVAPLRRRRQSVRPILEALEKRIVPTSEPPGTYHGIIASNEEFDQAGLYEIDAALTVNPNVTLSIGKAGVNVSLQIDDSVVLTVNGTLNITDPGLVRGPGRQRQRPYRGPVRQRRTGHQRRHLQPADVSSIHVNSAGKLTLTNSNFGWDKVILDSGSTATMHGLILTGELDVADTASIDITKNDFTSAAVVASGNASAHIDLTNNYWGTTATSDIDAKITDHIDNANLLTVDYNPFLTLLVRQSPISQAVDVEQNVTFTSLGSGQRHADRRRRQ
jgi:hypothetical protein